MQVKRRYDQAATPFDRLCATAAISQERKEQLQAIRNQTNPRQLRQEIQELTDYLLSLPGADPETTEDVRLTLLATPNSRDDRECALQGALPPPCYLERSQLR